MWICRYCAAHVNDDVLNCPHCGTPAPARLQPELAESISKKSNPCSATPEPSLLVTRGIPVLENQSRKRAVVIGALLGLLFPVFLGLVTWMQDRPGEWSFDKYLELLFITLICTLFGGVIGGCTVEAIHPFADLFFRLLGRRQKFAGSPSSRRIGKDGDPRTPTPGRIGKLREHHFWRGAVFLAIGYQFWYPV
jgi:hypothetical protein